MAIAEMKGDIARLLSMSSFLSCHVMATILDLIKTEIALFDLQTLKTLSCKHKVDGITVAEIYPFEIRHVTWGAFRTHILERIGRRESSILSVARITYTVLVETLNPAQSINQRVIERAMTVFYRLSIMTIVLSLTIRPSAAIVFCHRMSVALKLTGGRWVNLGHNFRVFPLE